MDPEEKRWPELEALAADLRGLADEVEALACLEEGPDFRERVGALKEGLRAMEGRLPGPMAEKDRILVVDDDEVSRDVLEHFFHPYGEVETAGGGSAAVAAVTRAVRGGRPFRIICLDIQMPDLDGQEALRRIRTVEEVYRVGAPAAVAMTTGLGTRDEVLRARRGGSEAYFVKPVDLAKLGAWVESLGVRREGAA